MPKKAALEGSELKSIEVGYLLPASTLAKLTGESKQTWYGRIKNGDIAHVSLGRRNKRVTLTDFEEWMRNLPRRRGHGDAMKALPPVHPFMTTIHEARQQILETIADLGLEIDVEKLDVQKRAA